MAITVIMPRQGQSVETCIISQWHKKKGDNVKTGDILFSYETDKAAFDVEAEGSGIILDIMYQEGDEVPVLSPVAFIGQPGEDTTLIRKDTSRKVSTIPAEKEITVENITAVNQEIVPEPCAGLRISPRARIMAEKLGINVNNLSGTGPNGRIIARDIEAASDLPGRHTQLKEQAGPLQSAAPEDYTDNPLSNVRKIIAKTMQESISNSAQLTHHMSADARKILELRARFKAEYEKGSDVNITLNDIVCFAVIRAIAEHPDANAHFLGDKIRMFNKIHLGLAVDTPRGLMVPSLQNAGDLSLAQLSEKLREIAGQCRKGSINPELLTGSAATFTVSNLGNYGVEMFTPIINPPQVAILGVNTILYRPADLGNGVFGFIPVIGLSLTYDHRAIDGGPATLFLKEIRDRIEHFSEQTAG
jgi:pyruvate dehydrogenase E2 component (dihydrolipoamide acetyltransferase)